MKLIGEDVVNRLLNAYVCNDGLSLAHRDICSLLDYIEALRKDSDLIDQLNEALTSMSEEWNLEFRYERKGHDGSGIVACHRSLEGIRSTIKELSKV